MAGTSRDDLIEVDNGLPQDWDITADTLDVDITDDDAIVARLYEWVKVLKLVGGIFGAQAIRREIAPGHFVTDAVRLHWDSFAPAERLPREEPERPRRKPEPKPEAERVVEDEEIELGADGAEDPDGIPDDHRRSSAAVLNG